MRINNLEGWTRQVLPQVYDESLSFIQLLNKVLTKLNEVIDATNEYFTDDVSNAVEAILQAWETSGELATIITEALMTGKADAAALEALETVVTETKTDIENLKIAAVDTVLDYMTPAEIADSQTETPSLDISAAVQTYVNAQIAADKNVLTFPAGVFRFKNVNLGSHPFAICGVGPSNGYIHDTTIQVISAMGASAFVGTNRYLLVTDLSLTSTGNYDDGNDVSFFKNTLTDGQFLTVRNVYGFGISGNIFDTLDLIDTVISNVHTDYCGNLIKGVKASWPASTTVTLEKLYITHGRSAFYLPYCTQSRMVDVIVENCDEVGNIEWGSWTIDNLYMENNTVGLKANNALLTYGYFYGYGAGDKILNDQSGRTVYEKGGSYYESRGAHVTRFSKHYEIAGNALTADTLQWIKIGKWYPQATGTKLKIVFMGGAGFSQQTAGDGLSGGVGALELNAAYMEGRDANKPRISAFAYHIGTSRPLRKIKIVASDEWKDKFDIYLQVEPYTRSMGYDVTTTNGYFEKDEVLNTWDPGKGNGNLTDVPFEFKIETETGAFTITPDGGLILSAPTIAGGAVSTTAAKFMWIQISGTYYKIALYA